MPHIVSLTQNGVRKKNLDVFGPCSYKNYHGHNYTLIVKVTGEVQTDTGYVYDMKKLSTLIRTHITEPLDHRNLNTDIPALEKYLAHQ